MIKKIEKHILKQMKTAHLSALSTAIVVKDKTVWTKGFGLYDREKNKLADEKTIYLMASITKTVTATAVMQLYEKEYFDLEEDVNDYLPFSMRNPRYPDTLITFRMLLSHTSGLSPEEGDLFFKKSFKPEALPNYYIRVIPANLKVENYPQPFLKDYLVPGGMYYRSRVWNNIPPGEEMAYSNIAYGVLGYLVEILSGKSFEEYCKENIFKPLDMKDSSYIIDNVDKKRLAIPYDFQSGEYISILPYTFLDYPSGSLRTTVLDLSHLLIAHMNGGAYNDVRILKKENIEEMQTIQCHKTKHKFKYGLGWQITGRSPSNKFIFNGGGFWGVYAKMKFSPYDKIGIIYFANAAPIMDNKIRNFISKRSAHKSLEGLLYKKAFLDYKNK